MTYIYDIIINLKKEYYDIFEWNPKDKLINIKRIPLIKVSSNTYTDFQTNRITVTASFLESIKNKTESYTKDKLTYCSLITTGKQTMCVLFDQHGNLQKKSSLYYDEEEESLENSLSLNISQIEYKKTLVNLEIIPRSIKEKKAYLLRFLSKTTNQDILNYLYYEYYEKEPHNNIDIKKNLIKELSTKWDPKKDKLYSLLKMTKINQ